MKRFKKKFRPAVAAIRCAEQIIKENSTERKISNYLQDKDYKIHKAIMITDGSDGLIHVRKFNVGDMVESFGLLELAKTMESNDMEVREEE